MNRNAIITGAAAVALAITLAGCYSNGPAKSLPASFSPSATVSAVKSAVEGYAASCIPSDGAGQVRLGKSLLGKDGRKAFAACLAIPPANRTPFEGALATAAEHVKWTDKDQRHAFFLTTLPALASKYHGTPAASPSPAVTG